jgi:DNA-binding Lrp family transcriptional regulator
VGVSAFVLIGCTLEASAQVAAVVGRLPGVKCVHRVSGPYDLIARVEAKQMAALAELISRRIHGLPQVAQTTTMLILT